MLISVKYFFSSIHGVLSPIYVVFFSDCWAVEFCCRYEVISVFYLTCSRLAGYDDSFSTQLIDGDGAFNVTGLDAFIKEVKLGECGLSYAVVSIMGPQSSGMQP